MSQVGAYDEGRTGWTWIGLLYELIYPCLHCPIENIRLDREG